jgi:hypothetical protein
MHIQPAYVGANAARLPLDSVERSRGHGAVFRRVGLP